MDDILNTDKFLTNIEKIMKVTGFFITALGDDSAGIFPTTWELNNECYFDTPDDLNSFKDDIKNLFEDYYGETTSVVTFEEYNLRCEEEIKELYLENPIRYLIKDGNNFKIANAIASYSSAIGDGIHLELPDWMSEDSYNGADTKIIKSDTKEFKDILIEEAGRLEREISNEEYRLSNAKRNLEFIQTELKYGN